MIENGMRYLRGYVKIQIQGYSPERFLNLCSYHHILIWGLAYEDHCYELCMSVRDFKRIRPFAKKTHTKVRVKEKYGFPFSLYNNRKRKLFFAGFIICIFLLQIYSMFIWDIHFTGNETRTDEALSSFLREKGVFAGMLKKEADCRKIVKEIRTQYDDVVWVSASLDGSRLKIQIKENEDSLEKEEKKKDENAVDLVASSDGVITKIVTRTGTPQVHVGDTVKKGDILVSGRVEIVNDSKEVTGYKYCHADADIFADTQMEYEDELSASYEEKVYDKKEKHRFYVKVKDTRVSFGSVKMKPDRCEFISKEYGVKAGKNFYLPFSYGMETVRSYHLREKIYTKEEMRAVLSKDFERFCKDLQKKGIQIRENSVKIHLYEKSAKAMGTLFLNERITQEADTEIITIERKETDESVGTDD